jgi:hypothetical protein
MKPSKKKSLKLPQGNTTFDDTVRAVLQVPPPKEGWKKYLQSLRGKKK